MKSKITSSPEFQAKLEDLLSDQDFITNELFRCPAVRDLLTLDRFKHLFNSAIKEQHSSESADVTIEHNTDPDRMFFEGLSKRPDLISNVLASINYVAQNSGHMSVLSIGARTEAEVFSLVNAGFALENIQCVDLFTYSPLIGIGDVNALDYEDNSFDLTVCGWVLEFCTDIDKACSEISRVTRPGGYIAIAGMHHPESTDLVTYNERKQHQDRVWYCSIRAVKNQFQLRDEDFVFRSGVEPDDVDKRGEVITIFKLGNTDV